MLIALVSICTILDLKIAIKLMPPVAILEAKPPDANTMDDEFPNNFHFLKLFNACL